MRRPRQHGAEPIALRDFASDHFPLGLEPTGQVRYLRCYLADLGARSVIEEPHYFDRDYLSEFVAFYATSAAGYVNNCRRASVFNLPRHELQAVFNAALEGETDALARLQTAFLGFIVIRPIPETPLGRTVLRWYPDRDPDGPQRVTAPSRQYTANVCGLSLHVQSLAWQQQDTAVGACATVALWSLFHSSARGEHHGIPTTADVTRSANRGFPLGKRVFPAADGLNLYQMCEAIRALGFYPAALEGDAQVVVDGKIERVFSPVRFASSSAALIRSGYPVLLDVLWADEAKLRSGFPKPESHAVCAVGFRDVAQVPLDAGTAVESDAGVRTLYIHDDNLGPNVRFALQSKLVSNGEGETMIATLSPEAPPPLHRRVGGADPTDDYGYLIPQALVAALPEEIRMSPDDLYVRAVDHGINIAAQLQRRAQAEGTKVGGVTFSARFFRLSSYVGPELAERLDGPTLAAVRLALANDVAPMSLHLGVVRISSTGPKASPLVDVLYDTTDSQPATRPFAHLLFVKGLAPPKGYSALGISVAAWK